MDMPDTENIRTDDREQYCFEENTFSEFDTALHVNKSSCDYEEVSIMGTYTDW